MSNGTNSGLCQVADFIINGVEPPAYAASSSRSSWSVRITPLLLSGTGSNWWHDTISHLEIWYVLQSVLTA
jgi:hypothetical protein